MPTTIPATAGCSSWRPISGITSKARTADEVFRVYLYDDYTKPLSPELRDGSDRTDRHERNVRRRDADDEGDRRCFR